MKQETYQFSDITSSTFKAAQKITPIIIDLIGLPESIVDLGGGEGGWLKAFKNLGTEKVCCIDHPSVDKDNLLIDEDEFIAYDLSNNMPSPIKSDLAISTEFAEHIPTSSSKDIVKFLTDSSSIILFSAAIPDQHGLNHINLQRPDFWRNLFAEKGYEIVDVVRPKIIFDKEIPYWFRQNLYLYVDKNVLNNYEFASEQPFLPDDFEIIHREVLNLRIKDSFKSLLLKVKNKLLD